jgi:two-component system LytT family response regulator
MVGANLRPARTGWHSSMTEQEKITIMIVDDEELARMRIRELVLKDPELHVMCECSNGAEAVDALAKSKPDILFLDIQMPDLNGFGVLRKLNTNEMPIVIFVTAFDEFAIKAFELHAFDYLLKPFKKKRFEDAVQHAKNALRTRNQKEWIHRTFSVLESISLRGKYMDRFTIKDKGRIFFLKARNVDWIEAEDNYVRLHAGKDSYLIREKIGSVEKELDPADFVRIHRGAIVNVESIQELQQWFKRDYRVVLRNGTILPLGRCYRNQLRKVLHSEF